MIIGGAAAIAAVVVGATVYVLVDTHTRDDPHGLAPLLSAYFAGSAAAGATLLFTFPATRDLGTEVP